MPSDDLRNSSVPADSSMSGLPRVGQLSPGAAEEWKDWLEHTLTRRFVRSPADECRAMPEAAAGEMIVLHFHDQLRLERLPLSRPRGAPATGAARRAPGKAGGLDQRLQLW